VAHRTPGVYMLEGRDDLAVLWDIRVQPVVRGHGIGHLLFEAAAATARQWQCRLLKIETQNINVAACRFYAREGCQLGGIHPRCVCRFSRRDPAALVPRAVTVRKDATELGYGSGGVIGIRRAATSIPPGQSTNGYSTWLAMPGRARRNQER
jgi:predicted GNAT family acetyltransferase